MVLRTSLSAVQHVARRRLRPTGRWQVAVTTVSRNRERGVAHVSQIPSCEATGTPMGASEEDFHLVDVEVDVSLGF